MASITILFLDRYRSSTGLPALVPGVFPLGFLPLPCVRFSLPLFPTPVLQVPAISGFPPSFVYLRSMVFWYGLCFPPEGFGSVFPSFPHCFFPFLASDLPTLVLLLPIHPQVIWLFPALFSEHGSTVPTLRISCCGPRVCRSAPTPLPRSGKVNRASGGN